MYFAHSNVYPSEQPRTLDFTEELAAMIAHRSPSPHVAPPHNPFDTNTTTPYRAPHNIFDVSAGAAPYTLPYEDGPFRAPSRSRSRSKAPPGRVHRKRSSVSSQSPVPRSPPRPQAILIPPTAGHGHQHHPVSPLSLHMHAQTAPSAWFVPGHADSSFRSDYRPTDSPFSLPTPDSMSLPHHFSASSGPASLPNGHAASSLPGSLPASLPASTLAHHHPALHHGTIHGTLGGPGGSPRSIVSGSTKESPPPPMGLGATQDAASKQAQLASEKRRRRRESHNAVERRRRDNINEKISELATLIPECMLDGGAGESALDTFGHPQDEEERDRKDANGTANGAGTPSAVKANKGMILRKSVEYIRYLQQLVNAQATRNRELEVQLSAAHANPHPHPNSHVHHHLPSSHHVSNANGHGHGHSLSLSSNASASPLSDGGGVGRDEDAVMDAVNGRSAGVGPGGAGAGVFGRGMMEDDAMSMSMSMGLEGEGEAEGEGEVDGEAEGDGEDGDGEKGEAMDSVDDERDEPRGRVMKGRPLAASVGINGVNGSAGTGVKVKREEDGVRAMVE